MIIGVAQESICLLRAAPLEWLCCLQGNDGVCGDGGGARIFYVGGGPKDEQVLAQSCRRREGALRDNARVQRNGGFVALGVRSLSGMRS